MLKNFLSLPLTRGMDLDDPTLTHIRRIVVQKKPFLRRIYAEWYGLILDELPGGAGGVLELGSGAGFFREYLPTAVTSEIFFCPGLDLACDATELPFATCSLKAIVMTDVLHHVPDAKRFFAEAGRCIFPGGVVIMVEPWVSAWSRMVYGKLHHEPFRPEAENWAFPSTGPLSGANGALPWILFHRDREKFKCEFPEWEISAIRPFMPLRYLLSGGVSMRPLMPGFSFDFWKLLESLLTPILGHVAMFALVCLRRKSDTPGKAEGLLTNSNSKSNM